MEREACVCDHGFERSDFCAEILIIIIIIIISCRKPAGVWNQTTKPKFPAGNFRHFPVPDAYKQPTSIRMALVFLLYSGGTEYTHTRINNGV